MNKNIIKNMYEIFLKDTNNMLKIFLLVIIVLGIFSVIVGIPFGIFWCISKIFELGFDSSEIMLFNLIFLICFSIISGYLEDLYNKAKNNVS